MKIEFHKYQGTGNDFVILDNRDRKYEGLSNKQVKLLCDRRFGIGADGLMMLIEHPDWDFEMVYFNADGKKGSLCGNGSRCMIKFARSLGYKKDIFRFLAADGGHEAKTDTSGTVSLKMNDVAGIKTHHSDFILDTGSPHYVKFVPDLKDYDVVKKGREIRYSREFDKDGINVNFIEQLDEPDKIFVRTYERGVENETLSCGTGVTAAALVCYHNENGFNGVEVKTPGGKLTVEYDRMENGRFTNIWLSGPAEKVFEGAIEF
jgi:diaminopimelate epimerase